METILTTDTLSTPLASQGIATDARIFANLGTAQLVEHAVRNGEGVLAKDGPLVVATGKHTGRSAKDKFIVKRRRDRRHGVVGQDQRADDARSFRGAQGGFPEGARRQGPALRRRPVRRLAARAPGQRPRDQRVRLAQPVHPHAAGAPDDRRARRFRARVHDHRPAELPRRSRASRLAHRDGDRGQLHREADPDRRHLIRRRDEEERVRHPQLPAAGEGRDADALLGQHRRGRQDRGVLRAFGHRQDHALGRRLAHPDRRRRAWLVGHRGVQLRGRLLRQDDPPLGRSRARDLRDHQALRHGARERGDRSGHPRARPRRRHRWPRTAAAPIRSTSSRTRRRTISARCRRT